MSIVATPNHHKRPLAKPNDPESWPLTLWPWPLPSRRSGRGWVSGRRLRASWRAVWTRWAAGATPATWWWTWCPSCRSSGTAAPSPCWDPSRRARIRTGGSDHTGTRPAWTWGSLCSAASETAASFSSICRQTTGHHLKRDFVKYIIFYIQLWFKQTIFGYFAMSRIGNRIN